MTYQSVSTFNKESIPLVCIYFKLHFKDIFGIQIIIGCRQGGSNSQLKRDLPIVPPDLPICFQTSPGTKGMRKNLDRPVI